MNPAAAPPARRASLDSYGGYPFSARARRASPPPAMAAGTLLPGRRAGKVKFFNSQKGFGFILPNEPLNDPTEREVFVHHTAITAARSSFRSLAEGEDVEFDLIRGTKGFFSQNVTGPLGAPVLGDPKIQPSRKVRTTYYHQKRPSPTKGDASKSTASPITLGQPSIQAASPAAFYPNPMFFLPAQGPLMGPALASPPSTPGGGGGAAEKVPPPPAAAAAGAPMPGQPFPLYYIAPGSQFPVMASSLGLYATPQQQQQQQQQQPPAGSEATAGSMNPMHPSPAAEYYSAAQFNHAAMMAASAMPYGYPGTSPPNPVMAGPSMHHQATATSPIPSVAMPPPPQVAPAAESPTMATPIDALEQQFAQINFVSVPYMMSPHQQSAPENPQSYMSPPPPTATTSQPSSHQGDFA